MGKVTTEFALLSVTTILEKVAPLTKGILYNLELALRWLLGCRLIRETPAQVIDTSPLPPEKLMAKVSPSYSLVVYLETSRPLALIRASAHYLGVDSGLEVARREY